jgi:hypothetical protein
MLSNPRTKLFSAEPSTRQEGIGRTDHLLSYDMTQTACVLLAVRTCVLSCCLAVVWGIQIQMHRLMGGIFEVSH